MNLYPINQRMIRVTHGAVKIELECFNFSTETVMHIYLDRKAKLAAQGALDELPNTGHIKIIVPKKK